MTSVGGAGAAGSAAAGGSMELVLVKGVALLIGSFAAAKGWVIAATDNSGGPDYVNVVLNFASLAILVAGLFMAPKAIRARTAQAQLVEKDQVIATHKQLADVRQEEVEQTKRRLRDMGLELDAAKSFESHWRGRYEEQQQYTAQPALEAIKQVLEHADTESQRRHDELMQMLRALSQDGNRPPH